MASEKNIKALIKLQIQGGKANPAPPVGPALGQHGVNIMDFCNQFNTMTKDKVGDVIPVVLTVYEDRSFSIVLKSPPASVLIKKALNIKSGSSRPNTESAGTISQDQLKEIAEIKMPDLNVDGDIDAAIKIISGTAASMGIGVA